MAGDDRTAASAQETPTAPASTARDERATGAGRAADGDAVAALRERGAAVRDRELATALSRLESRVDLPPGQREAVAAMADAVVAGVLEAPVAALRESDDPPLARTALWLFDADG